MRTMRAGARLVLALGMAALSATTARAGWIYNPNTNRNYDYLSGQYWEDAKTAAEALSAHLVTINDGLESGFVLDNFGPHASPYLWCGLKNQNYTPGDPNRMNGPWEWAEGGGAGGSFLKGSGGDSYTNWDGAEPNGDGPYTMIYASGTRAGKWNDVPGTRNYTPVIEQDAEVPTWVLNPQNGQLYTVIANTVHGNSWTNAEAMAQRWGAHLVTVNDAAENAWINNEANLPTGGKPYKYVGMHNPARDNEHWEWISGTGGYWNLSTESGTSYVYWNRPPWSSGGEPNNVGEDAVMIYASNGLWNDVSKGRDFPAIVEADGLTELLTSPVTGLSYGILQARTTWENAYALGQQLGIELADVPSDAENEWLRSAFAGILGDGDDAGLWLGLTDRLAEGSWQWSSGAPLSYTHWAPDGQLGGNAAEDYVYLDLRDGLWRDRDGVNLFYPLYVVPEPTSALLLAGGLLALARRRRRRA